MQPQEKVIKLKPVSDPVSDYDAIEIRIKKAFREALYFPILRELDLPQDAIENDRKSPLISAIESGRITYSDSTFHGTYNAGISKELRALGAKWDKKTQQYKLAREDIPQDVWDAMTLSDARYRQRIARCDRRLSKISPADIADRVKTRDIFLSSLKKTDRKISSSIEEHKFYVAPKFDEKHQAKIADEWQNNMDKWIKDFSAEEIQKLRKDIADNVLAGNRREDIEDKLQRSYGVTTRKAKFLARQETNLLLAKYKESRYTSAGIQEYIWRCVTGTAAHPVRPAHKALDKSKQRWDDPPITSEPNEPVRRNNPKEDYNCRCYAIPVLKIPRRK
jgi:SPP1 gp7 family putative phage head morphogenesis protein